MKTSLSLIINKNKMLLYLILFLFSAALSYVWYMKEHLTLEEVDKKVTSLSKDVKKIDKELKTQEERMGAASTQASQAQALLRVSKS
jgi:hypothetical protein